ncbi:MAG TPA: DUF1318 domain-containing protein [Rhodospirillales bacterium]|nr:DUF1318 domain-containing protein [Rhodospirillales bacterium]
MWKRSSTTRICSDRVGLPRRRVLVAATVALLLAPSLPSWALSLAEAKAKGWVGERADGYLGLVDPKAPAAARALVEEVNAKRRKAYEAIARKNGVPVEAVAAIAGEKAIAKTPPGQYVMGTDGRWRRKK